MIILKLIRQIKLKQCSKHFLPFFVILYSNIMVSYIMIYRINICWRMNHLPLLYLFSAPCFAVSPISVLICLIWPAWRLLWLAAWPISGAHRPHFLLHFLFHQPWSGLHRSHFNTSKKILTVTFTNPFLTSFYIFFNLENFTITAIEKKNILTLSDSSSVFMDIIFNNSGCKIL